MSSLPSGPSGATRGGPSLPARDPARSRGLRNVALALAALLSAAFVAAFVHVNTGADSGRAASVSSVSSPPARTAPAGVTSTTDTSRVVLSVKGMYCTSCERTVTAMLTRTPGVVRAAVSVERGEAVVVYDPARTSAPKLVAVLERLGYRAVVKTA